MSVFYTNKKYFIYAHINKINQKAYIGITCQTKAKYRWGKDGRHYRDQQRFYAAIEKYGWDAFEHVILAENISGYDIARLEREYIIKYNSYINGYNATPGGDHECRQHKARKKVYQYDLSTQAIVNEFESISDAARWVEINTDSTGSHKRIVMSISELCNNKYENRKSYFGFGWCFAGDYPHIKKYKNNRGDKSVLQYTLTGDFIKQWPSIAEAQRTLGINNIGLACAGKRKKAGGFKWEYNVDLATTEVR